MDPPSDNSLAETNSVIVSSSVSQEHPKSSSMIQSSNSISFCGSGSVGVGSIASVNAGGAVNVSDSVHLSGAVNDSAASIYGTLAPAQLSAIIEIVARQVSRIVQPHAAFFPVPSAALPPGVATPASHAQFVVSPHLATDTVRGLRDTDRPRTVPSTSVVPPTASALVGEEGHRQQHQRQRLSPVASASSVTQSSNMDSGYKCMNGSHNGGNVSLALTLPGDQQASYLNQRGDDYLTPTSPVSPTPPKLPAFPPSFGTQSKQQSKQQFRLPRSDSGIETDVSRSPTSSVSTTNPRASTLYEYIDPKDIHVQERHGIHNVSQGESTSSGLSSATRASTQPFYSPPNTDSENVLSEENRHRVNPVYDALEKSGTQLYAKTCHCKQRTSALKQLRYLWCAFICLIVIAIFLLAVIAYMSFNLIPGLQSHLQAQGDRLNALELSYEKHVNQSTALQFQLTPKNKSVSNTASDGLADMFVHLNNSVIAFNAQLQQVNTSLKEQIHRINLKTSPVQNLSSVTDLSACTYSSISSAVALPAPRNNTTSWQPESKDLQNYVVMSASCEVINGDQQSLEAKKISSDKVQYRCRCDGGDASAADRRYCRIHLVMCPRLLTNQIYP